MRKEHSQTSNQSSLDCEQRIAGSRSAWVEEAKRERSVFGRHDRSSSLSHSCIQPAPNVTPVSNASKQSAHSDDASNRNTATGLIRLRHPGLLLSSFAVLKSGCPPTVHAASEHQLDRRSLMPATGRVIQAA